MGEVWLWFLKRTAEQRRQRYKMLRKAGFSVQDAIRIRDWRISKIKGVIKNYPDGKICFAEGK